MDEGLSQDGLTAAAGTPQEFGDLLKSEIDRWGKLAKERNIKPD